MDLLTGISDDEDNFKKSYEAFSKDLKLGFHQDSQSCSKLAEFLRFYSTGSLELIGFKHCITRRKMYIKLRMYMCSSHSCIYMSF